MKKFRFPLAISVLMLAVSCSSENSAEFNEANLVGTWDVTKAYLYNIQNDQQISSVTLPQGYLYYILNNDGTIIQSGTAADESDTAMFEAIVWNGKNILRVYRGTESDTVEVVSFNPPNMTWDAKIDEGNDNDGDENYPKFELLKRQ